MNLNRASLELIELVNDTVHAKINDALEDFLAEVEAVADSTPAWDIVADAKDMGVMDVDAELVSELLAKCIRENFHS